MNSTFETYLLDQEGVDTVEQTFDRTQLQEQELPQGFWTEL